MKLSYVLVYQNIDGDVVTLSLGESFQLWREDAGPHGENWGPMSGDSQLTGEVIGNSDIRWDAEGIVSVSTLIPHNSQGEE